MYSTNQIIICGVYKMEATMQLSAANLLETASHSTSDLIGQYLYHAENVRGLARTTLKSRRIYLRQFLNYLEEIGIEDIRHLTNVQLDMYFVGMGKRVSYRNVPLSTHSVNSSKRAIKSFLVWCSSYREMDLRVRTSEIRERTPEGKHPDILTHSDILFVIRRIKSKQDKLMVSVLYEAGLRISELADMKIEHLRGTTLDVVGKGSKHRITFISPILATQLHAHMAANGWREGHVFRPLMHGDGESGYQDTDTIRRRIKFYFRKFLGREMHPHLLRHAFALRLLKNGCNLRSIQKMLGHSKIETTMIYLRIDNDYLSKEYEKSFGGTAYVT